MSVIGLNKSVCKFIRLRPHQAIWNAAQYEFVMILFIQIPEMLRFGILPSQCVCVWWEISLLFLLIPHLSSFIFNPPSSTPNSPSVSDEPGQLKIYLPKKLLECLPKCSSLPKERHRWNTNEVRMRHTQEGNIRDSETNSVFFAGDSSLANVTLRDEGEVNKHNGSFSLWDPKNCDTKK